MPDRSILEKTISWPLTSGRRARKSSPHNDMAKSSDVLGRFYGRARGARAEGKVLQGLEQLGIKVMALQKFVEFCAISLCQLCRLRHVTARNLEQLC